MADLDFEGSEPVWAKYDFLERIRMLGKDGRADPMDESDPQILRNEVQRLQEEKARLANELTRTQEQLKLQVNLDKDSSTSARLEIEQIKAQIQHDTKSI